MEGIYLETLIVEFGVAFTALLALIGVVAGLFLGGMAEEERTGARLFWAESPFTEIHEVAPPPEERVRLAA